MSISVLMCLSWTSTTRSLEQWNSNICRLMWPSPWFLLVLSLPGDECGWTNGNNVGLTQMKKANKTSREASSLWWQHLHYLTSILATTEKRRAAFCSTRCLSVASASLATTTNTLFSTFCTPVVLKWREMWNDWWPSTVVPPLYWFLCLSSE